MTLASDTITYQDELVENSKKETPVQGIEPWAPRYLISQVMRARNVSHYTIPDDAAYNTGVRNTT